MSNLPYGVTDAMTDVAVGDDWTLEGHDEGCDGDFCDCLEREAELRRGEYLAEQMEWDRDSRW